jgi:alpha-beta hydrolase superfamily lysophospholipase
MTADIKQLADIARDENPGLPLLAFGHSMGSALTQAHIENHGDLLAGAILCGTLGAIPGVDDDDYPGVIAQLQALATGLDAPKHPASSLVACWRNSTPRSLAAWPTPPARSGRLATQRKSGCSRATRCAASHSPTR